MINFAKACVPNGYRKELLEKLALIQNMPKNQNVDIMTIAYLMDDKQLENYARVVEGIKE